MGGKASITIGTHNFQVSPGERKEVDLGGLQLIIVADEMR